tara:strand:+ start:253 stop:444 length:192 start_codon:yes stop_codon:yes gene_type:complete
MDSARVFRVIDGLITVVGAIVRAAARGDQTSVDEILGDDLEITIARAAASSKALAKLGPSKKE